MTSPSPPAPLRSEHARPRARHADASAASGTPNVLRLVPSNPGRATGGSDGDGPPDPARARLLCDLVRLAVDGIAALAPDAVARALGPTPRGLQHRRQIGMYLAHVAFGVRTADVARGFARDTTTAYHAYRQVEDMRDDPAIDAFLDAVEDLVTGADALATAPGRAA